MALDATQVDDLKILLAHFDYPAGLAVAMKETLILVIDTLVHLDKIKQAGHLFKSPNDVLRYLWYKHTGYLQLVEPKNIRKRKKQNSVNRHRQLDDSLGAEKDALKDL